MQGDQVMLQTPPSVGSDALPANAAGEAAPDHAAPGTPSGPNWAAWSNLWQVPSLIVSIALISWGLSTVSRPTPPNDFDGALTQVEQFLGSGQFELAASQLRTVIEPNLGHASAAQKARFHASAADYLSLSQRDNRIQDAEAHRRVGQHYVDAVSLGLDLSAAQLERWADSLLAVNDLAEARKRLHELERLSRAEAATASPAGEILAIRSRVFRKIIEQQIQLPDVPFDEIMTALSEYRLSGSATADDEAWVVARQTELRLQVGQARPAVDWLLVEMRRLEDRALSEEHSQLGELYGLLGRGYFELGEYARAQNHLEHALTLFSGSETQRGEALTLLGQIAVSLGDLDAAMEHFQTVVRDFITTRSYLPGLLGRAEVQSMMGSHDASLADYRLLCEKLPQARLGETVIPPRVAESLCERHDAALALGKVERALDYVTLADGLFAPDQVPAGVLYRLASSNRQIADNLIAEATKQTDQAADSGPAEVDPAVRREANIHYERAGEYFVRHAGAASLAEREQGQDSPSSLWLAADSFDLCGRLDLAIEHFTKYLGMQPADDPRRAMTLFRLGQAYQARLEFEQAIHAYEALASDRGRTAVAVQSYVPLARCYIAINRAPEARQLLKQVLGGTRLLQPDARDYRDALVELGRIEYNERAHAPAIEAFTEFLERYPTDARNPEVRYLLADSYRANALALAERVKQDAGLSVAEAGRLNGISVEQLQTALDLFAQVCGSPTLPDGREPDPARQDMLRRAALYQADCAWALGQHEQAIDLYDRAARQYSIHQSSMYALIQIVNCYNALGDPEHAAAAHHRALVRLKQLPDDAFTSPDSLMDRAAWEQWLENNPVGPARTAAATHSDG